MLEFCRNQLKALLCTNKTKNRENIIHMQTRYSSRGMLQEAVQHLRQDPSFRDRPRSPRDEIISGASIFMPDSEPQLFMCAWW